MISKVVDDNTVVHEIEITAPPATEKEVFFDPMSQEAKVIKDFVGLSTNVKRRISKAAGSKDAEDKYFGSTGYGLLAIAETPYNMNELATFYDNSPSNHAAVIAKVSNVVGLGYNFNTSESAKTKMQQMTDKESVKKTKKKIDRVKSEMTTWLDGLNDDETFQQILYKVATDYEVFGNGYLEIGRTVTGSIGYIGHVPAVTVRRRLKKDGYVQVVGQYITFFRNFGSDIASPITSDTSPNELIHVSKYSPRSTFYGVPDSVAASTAIVGDSNAAQYNLQFFNNSATPRYIVTITGGRLSKRAEDKLFKFLQTSLRGNPHRTLFIPLPVDSEGNKAELKMERVDADVTDGSWDSYRERNKQDILMAHAVPPSRIGGASEGNIGEALAAARMFKEQVVVPTQAIFEKAINKIIKEKTDIITFDLNELSLTDELAQSQIIERLLRNQAITINEAREMLGLPAHPDGDKFFEPNPQTSAEQNAQAKGTRERDKKRVDNNSDSPTTVSGRNPKGSGSKE